MSQEKRTKRRRRNRTSQKNKRSSQRALRVESLETRTLLAADFLQMQNPIEPADVNGDGEVAPMDVLTIVNEINAPRQDRGGRPMFFDVNGDGALTPFDALMVMNRLNHRTRNERPDGRPNGRPDGRPGDPPPEPELEAENRSIDGMGNNLSDPTQGAAETNLIRFGYPAVFPDGHGDVIETADQPNARDVSNLINDQDESILNDRHLTDWIVQWGQFLTHDIDLSLNGAANNDLSDGTIGDFDITVDDPNDPLVRDSGRPNSHGFKRTVRARLVHDWGNVFVDFRSSVPRRHRATA